jgi:hypothetical protein
MLYVSLHPLNRKKDNDLQLGADAELLDLLVLLLNPSLILGL